MADRRHPPRPQEVDAAPACPSTHTLSYCSLPPAMSPCAHALNQPILQDFAFGSVRASLRPSLTSSLAYCSIVYLSGSAGIGHSGEVADDVQAFGDAHRCSLGVRRVIPRTNQGVAARATKQRVCGRPGRLAREHTTLCANTGYPMSALTVVTGVVPARRWNRQATSRYCTGMSFLSMM